MALIVSFFFFFFLTSQFVQTRMQIKSAIAFDEGSLRYVYDHSVLQFIYWQLSFIRVPHSGFLIIACVWDLLTMVAGLKGSQCLYLFFRSCDGVARTHSKVSPKPCTHEDCQGPTGPHSVSPLPPSVSYGPDFPQGTESYPSLQENVGILLLVSHRPPPLTSRHLCPQAVHLQASWPSALSLHVTLGVPSALSFAANFHFVFRLGSLRLHSHLTNYCFTFLIDGLIILILIVGRSAHIFSAVSEAMNKTSLFWHFELNIWLIPVIWFCVLGVLKRGSVLASSTHRMQNSGRVCVFRTEAYSCLRFSWGQLPPQGLRGATACYTSPSTRSFSIFSPSLLNSLVWAGLYGCSGEDRRLCALPCVPLRRGDDINEVTPGETGVWRWQFWCLSGPRAWRLSGCFPTCPLGTNRCRDS